MQMLQKKCYNKRLDNCSGNFQEEGLELSKDIQRTSKIVVHSYISNDGNDGNDG